MLNESIRYRPAIKHTKCHTFSKRMCTLTSYVRVIPWTNRISVLCELMKNTKTATPDVKPKTLFNSRYACSRKQFGRKPSNSPT